MLNNKDLLAKSMSAFGLIIAVFFIAMGFFLLFTEVFEIEKMFRNLLGVAAIVLGVLRLVRYSLQLRKFILNKNEE